MAAWGGSSGGMVVKAIDDGTSQLISRKRKGANTSNGGSTAKISNNTTTKDTLMPKETCPVCGIQITYKNLARHIKLRHKIKYKFCHKCRKFVPNDTYEDHRLTCTAVGGDLDAASEVTSNGGQDGGHDSVDASDYLDMDGASALVINTDNDEDPAEAGEAGAEVAEGEEGKRSNTSKNKLESLLGKEFKHPRRKCGICGYMVSYSNYKRHLKNAHPSIQDEDVLEAEAVGSNEEVKYLGHQMDEEDVQDDDELEDQAAEIIENKASYAECTNCGDHIMSEFLERHMKMNHPEVGGVEVTEVKKEVKMRECPVCQVNMRVEGIVKHCKLKHKLTYKWCRPCQKYILKKEFKLHIQSPAHREVVNEAEKHSSHEDAGEDEDDLLDIEDSIDTVSNETEENAVSTTKLTL